MNLTYLTSRLAPLASERYQLRYGVGATVSEYIVAAELLEGACECIEKLEGTNPIANELNKEAQAFNSEVKEQLRQIAKLLRSESGGALENLAWTSLMKNPTWLGVCSHARSALTALGFSVEEWERSEMEPGNVL